MAIKTSKQALAEHLQMDFAELKDYEYQPGRFTKPVYTIDENYYCATKGNAKPAKSTRDDASFNWDEVQDRFIWQLGFKIWKATERDEN